ncbi:MAG: hypothetical protein ACI9Y1_001298 [Lentisphaeria bacterium]|jgi:hypothetical protein
MSNVIWCMRVMGIRMEAYSHISVGRGRVPTKACMAELGIACRRFQND